MNPMTALLLWCGYVEILIGVFLAVLLTGSLLDADGFLTSFLGFPAASLGRLAGNSWAQAAVAFGMHAYADIANGREQVQRLRSGKVLPKITTVWNSTRAFVSFVFCVSVARGVAAVHGADFTQWPTGALVLIAVLAFDAILLRPAAVFCQRALEDARPAAAKAELNEWRAFSPLQRACRSVFYYEAVLSGTSGIAYLLAPELFPWLFGFAAGDATPVMLFGLSVFGGCVSAFGLYQMRCALEGARPARPWGPNSPARSRLTAREHAPPLAPPSFFAVLTLTRAQVTWLGGCSWTLCGCTSSGRA